MRIVNSLTQKSATNSWDLELREVGAVGTINVDSAILPFAKGSSLFKSAVGTIAGSSPKESFEGSKESCNSKSQK